MKYNKLVRDRIPKIIEKEGKQVITHIAAKAEYKKKLYEKLHEEVGEFVKSGSQEELADILEVIDAVISLHHFNRRKLKAMQKQKATKRGGFKKRIILEKTK